MIVNAFLPLTTVKSTDTLIAFGSLLLGLSTTILGGIAWYVNSAKEKYAAQRDFAHLRRNQEQISQGITMLSDQVDSRLDVIERDILEIRTVLTIKFRQD